MIKKIFIYLFFFANYINYVFAGNINAENKEVRDKMLEWINSDIVIEWVDNWKEWVISMFTYARDIIFSLLALIIIWTFLFVGYKIIMSRWNPEEFKKAIALFVYAIIGLLIISLSWVIVMFISGLNI